MHGALLNLLQHKLNISLDAHQVFDQNIINVKIVLCENELCRHCDEIEEAHTVVYINYDVLGK